MKKALLLLPFLALLACDSNREEGKALLVLENTLDVHRVDQLVVIDRETLENQLGEIRDEQIILVSINNEVIPSQLDDMDLDGRWDELAFVHTFTPNQTVQLNLQVAPATEMPEFAKRTNVHFAKVITKDQEYEPLTSAVRLQGTNTEITQQHFQFEGPGWENDKVGFRNYFDERNGMDIWGKTTTEMVLDNVGINENYHVMQSWGMDILKVANSLGAGALALQYNDSLYRVTAPEEATYELVVEGPIRSVFNLNFSQVSLGDTTVSVKHQISIVAGEYAYRSDVWIENVPSGVNVVTGIVNLQTENMYTIESDDAQVIYTHDRQSFDEEYLGMAVMTQKKLYKDAFATPETGEGITQTFAVILASDNGKWEYRFYACWEKTDEYFADRLDFEQFLKDEANTYSNPIVIKWE